MAQIEECVPGREARVVRTAVPRVAGRTGTIVEVSRVRRPATGPTTDKITLDIPGHGEVTFAPADIEVVA